MLKIRRPLGRLIFNMGIAIPGKTVFLIETAPCCTHHRVILDHAISGGAMYFIVSGAGLDQFEGFTEDTSDAICTQRSTADCDVYWYSKWRDILWDLVC